MAIKMTNSNPLIKHFRQPQLYIKLPSQGNWYKPGTIDIPVTKELPVFAMTAKDEIIAKTPDALMTGQSVVDIIHSCVPNIKNAWEMPVIDLNQILISIRRATYGNAMDFVSVCPHCGKKNENTLNLEALLNSGYIPNFDESFKTHNLEFFMQPQTFKNFNQVNLKKFEIQRVVASLAHTEISESEKINKVQKALNDLLEITMHTMADNVIAIKTSDGQLVDRKEYILEFIQNCQKDIWEKLTEKINSIVDGSPAKSISLKCTQTECQKDYSTPLIFDLSNFFG